uniref:Response regulator transcription factor n=2 Tax=Breznakiella homolactica TaxID=2798577 RepID=A0A7T7XRU0_9SPIR
MGYWAGTHPARLLKQGYPLAAAFFVLAPALFLLEESAFLYVLVYTLVVICQLALSNTAPFLALAYSYRLYWFYFLASLTYAWRIPSFFSAWALRHFSVSTGISTFTATVLALVFYFLIRKLPLPAKETGASRTITDQDIKTKLSRREQQIAYLLIQNLTNKEIAEQLFISEGTVENHNHRVYRKLGVPDRLELRTRYADKGLPGN